VAPEVLGSLGMGISMMLIAILLSFKGTDKEKATSTASIAFFITVSRLIDDSRARQLIPF
jgi:hypothetical protein